MADVLTSPLELRRQPAPGAWLLTLRNSTASSLAFTLNVPLHRFGYELSRTWSCVQLGVSGSIPSTGTDAIEATGSLAPYGQLMFSATSVLDPDAKSVVLGVSGELGDDPIVAWLSLTDAQGEVALNPENLQVEFFGSDIALDPQIYDALVNGKWTLPWIVDNMATGGGGGGALIPDDITIKQIAGYLTVDLSAAVSTGLGSSTPVDVDDSTTLLGFNVGDGSLNLHWAKITGKLPPTGTGADGVRIQEALDDKGWVELRNGTYLDVAVSVPLRGKIVGTGMNTNLRPGAAQADPVVSVLGQAWEVTLADFQVEGWTGVGSYAAAAHGIYFDSGLTPLAYPTAHGDNGPYLSNIRVSFMTGDGITFYDPTGGFTLVGVHTNAINVYQNNYGFVVNGATDSNWNGIVAADNRRNGFKVFSANSRWVNCKSYFSGDSGSAAEKADGRGYGWFLDYVHCDQFTNCEAQDSMHHGWYIRQCSFITLNACVADGNGYNNIVTPDGAAGFYLTDQIDGPVVMNVIGRNFRAVKSQDYHVYAEAGITSRIRGSVMVDTLSGMVGAANIGGPGAGTLAYNSGTGLGLVVV